MRLFEWLKAPLGKSCCFCGLSDGNLQYVVSYFSYSTYHYFFHEICLKKVLGKPGQYGHRAVDIALDIEQCITRRKKNEIARHEAAHKALGRLEGDV